MSSIIGRTAFRASRPLRNAGINAGQTAAAENKATQEALKTGARRDPELYILFSIMAVAIGGAGWHFSSKPTSSTSENRVAVAADSEPWKEGGSGPYKYHPGGDPKAPRKEAPSALNTVIIPNVNLPKELHDRFNKYGKEEYE